MATPSRAQFGPTGLPSKDTVSKGLGTLAEEMAPKGQATLSEVRATPARQSKALTSFAGKCTKNSALPWKQLTLLVWTDGRGVTCALRSKGLYPELQREGLRLWTLCDLE